MSIEVLKNLDQEVRRLLIAGSKLAPGDLRLGKLQPQLSKLGEASPVFARVSQAVELTIDPKGENAAERLLELASLLQSIMYTQGQTETKGEMAPLAGTSDFTATQTTFRKLKPVKDALLQKGQGRLEVIREAYEEGIFRDTRLLIPAVTALDEVYFDIPELLEYKVIPEYGDAALLVLQGQLRLDGGKGDARRLRLIHRLLGASGMSLYEQAAVEGSLDLKTAAIELLGGYPEQESFLLEQSKDRRKDIRRAALLALAHFSTASASDRIYEALTSKDREIAVDAVIASSDFQLALRVVEYARTAFGQLKQERNNETILSSLQSSLSALDGCQLYEVLELLQELLSDQALLAKDQTRLQEAALRLLAGLDFPEAKAFAISLKDTKHPQFLACSFEAALHSLSAEQLYVQYSDYLGAKPKSLGAAIINVLYSELPSVYNKIARSEEVPASLRDSRWVNDLIQLDEPALVCRLAHEGDKGTIQYLTGICKEGSKAFRRHYDEALLALFYIGYKDAPELLKSVYTPERVDKMYYLYDEQILLLGLLPSSDADWLAAFSQDLGLSTSMRDRFAEIAEAVRSKPIETKDEGKGWAKWLMSKIH